MIRSELVLTLAAALVAATLGARANVRFLPAVAVPPAWVAANASPAQLQLSMR